MNGVIGRSFLALQSLQLAWPLLTDLQCNNLDSRKEEQCPDTRVVVAVVVAAAKTTMTMAMASLHLNHSNSNNNRAETHSTTRMTSTTTSKDMTIAVDNKTMVTTMNRKFAVAEMVS